MQQVAEPWLVLSLSNSPVLLGLDAFAMDAPVWVLTLFGGILADHADRRRVIFFFQAIQMLCPLVLVFLILSGALHVWMIVALSFVVGITDALSMPAFQSIVPLIVKSDQIEKAIALNSTQFNLSRVLGPAIAGLVMASFGAVGCFATNALSYVPFLAVILWVLPKNKKPKHFDRKLLGTEPWYSEARAIGKDPLLRGGLLTVLVTSLFCGPLIAFAPVLIKDILHSDASHFGGAISAFGIGGLLGALLLLGLGKKVERRKLSSACAILVAVVVVVAALNRSLFALSAILVIAGAALTMTNTSVNSILQGVARDQIRGQAASLFMLAMRGGLSLGNLITGFSVHFFGISHALVANGLVAIVIHAWMYRSWACTTNVKLSPTKAGFIAVLEFRNET
jgi:predicted MFS family arabinose efflux permease